MPGGQLPLLSHTGSQNELPGPKLMQPVPGGQSPLVTHPHSPDAPLKGLQYPLQHWPFDEHASPIDPHVRQSLTLVAGAGHPSLHD